MHGRYIYETLEIFNNFVIYNTWKKFFKSNFQAYHLYIKISKFHTAFTS